MKLKNIVSNYSTKFNQFQGTHTLKTTIIIIIPETSVQNYQAL